MNVKQFEFRDLATGWHLQPARFDRLNLLVGISGVGKTRIVTSLERVVDLAVDAAPQVEAMEWTLAFAHRGMDYQWHGRTQARAQAGSGANYFERERLTCNGGVVVERDGDSLLFSGRAMPRLTRAESALALFADDDALAPAIEGLRQFIFSDPRAPHFADEIYPPGTRNSFEAELRERSEDKESSASGLPTHHTLRDKLLLLWMLQARGTDAFRDFEERFIDVFPTVEKLHITWSPAAQGASEVLSLSIQERGVEPWIHSSAISAGMMRTLSLLFEVQLLKRARVIVIDEIESSLGINCMPQVLDMLAARADCQIIVTTHHPYIINNLAIDTWKLVRRHGSEVSLHPARELENLDASSRHRAFIQLINLPEYEEGIA